MESLKKGVLVGRTRTKFVTTIAEAIFQRKSRPLSEEYHAGGRTPQLKNGEYTCTSYYQGRVTIQYYEWIGANV